jgi:heptosyltransferase-2
MRYLVIRFSSLGDCILLCPFLTSLKKGGAEEVAVVTKAQYKDLFSAAPAVDTIYCVPPKAGLADIYKIASSLRNSGFSVIDAHNTLRSRMFTAFLKESGPRFEKYTADRLALMIFKKKVRIPTMRRRYEALGEPYGISPDSPAPNGAALKLPAKIEEWAANLAGRERESWVAVAPGSRWPMKRWAKGNFEELTAWIAARFGHRIILLGDAGDRAEAASMARALGDAAIDLTGRTSILQAAACLKRSRALITNDSGLLHLAEAVGTPVLAIFGPTVEEWGYYPYLPQSKSCERSLPCRPCSRNGSRPCPLGTHECLARIPVSSVKAMFEDMVAGAGPRRYVLP